ncbi:MAG: class I SAM-dependent rRNA methyltransferase, partial [Acetobacterales bacterium]
MRCRLDIPSDAQRLVHGEADGLPGLIVDRYADVLVAQFLSAGAARWRDRLVPLLLEVSSASCLYERSDSAVRDLEGLSPEEGWRHGGGGTEVEIREHDWSFSLDFGAGHKTGYYLDQRDNRKLLADWVARLGCASVLNCHAYTGGFTVAALKGGAREVVSVDTSAPSLGRARRNVALNGFDDDALDFVEADANATIRRFVEEGRRFDAIVLDPPKFAASAKQVERAARAYKDINRVALMALAPGGMLMTFSCSGAVGAELFHKIVA